MRAHPTDAERNASGKAPARTTVSSNSMRRNAKISKRMQRSGSPDDANGTTMLSSKQETPKEQNITNTNCLSTTSAMSLARALDQRYILAAPTLMGLPAEVKERVFGFLWPQGGEMVFCPCLEHGEAIQTNHQGCATVITDAHDISNLSTLARAENARRIANLRRVVSTIIPTPLNNVSRQLYHDTDWRFTDHLIGFRDVRLTVCSPNCLHQIVSCATREQLARITDIKMEWWPLRRGAINDMQSLARLYRQLHNMYQHFIAEARQTWVQHPGNGVTTSLHRAVVNLIEILSGQDIQRSIIITFAGAVLNNQPNPIIITPGFSKDIPGLSCCVAH